MKYQLYTFVRATVSSWKRKFQHKGSGEPAEKCSKRYTFTGGEFSVEIKKVQSSDYDLQEPVSKLIISIGNVC